MCSLDKQGIPEKLTQAEKEVFNSLSTYFRNPSEAKKQVVNEAIFNLGEKGRNQRIREFWIDLQKLKLVTSSLTDRVNENISLREDVSESILQISRDNKMFKRWAMVSLGSTTLSLVAIAFLLVFR